MNHSFFLLQYSRPGEPGQEGNAPEARPECPPRADLIDRKLGRLAGTRLEQVDDHLASCERCARVASSLEGFLGTGQEHQTWSWAGAIFRSSGVNLALIVLLWVVSWTMASKTLANIDWWVTVQQRLLTGGALVALLMAALTAALYASGRLNPRIILPGAVGFLIAWAGSWGYAEYEQADTRSNLNALFLGTRWVTYDPPGFDPYPETQRMPTVEEIKRELQLLHDPQNGAGFDGVITFKATGTFAHIPKIAKEIGFRRVIMGIFITNDEQGRPVRPDDQIRAAIEAREWVDGYCLGHNASTQLDITTLAMWMQELRAATGRPVTTTAPLVNYLGERGRELRSIGDWYMPDVHGSWTMGATPRELYQELQQAIRDLTVLSRDKPVILKMVSCPSAGGKPYSEQAQADFYTWLSRDLYLPSGMFLSYYNGFDLPWMSHERHPDEWSPPGQHIGLFTADGKPKPAVAVVRKGFPIQNRP